MQLTSLSRAVEMKAEQETDGPVEAAEPQNMEWKSGGLAAPGRKVADLKQSLHSGNAWTNSDSGFPYQYGILTFSEQNYSF